MFLDHKTYDDTIQTEPPRSRTRSLQAQAVRLKPTSSCHQAACCVSKRQCHPFSGRSHPSASGYLGVPSLAPSPARRRGCSPHPGPSGRFGPTPALQQAHATVLPFFQACPALRAPEPYRAFNRARSPGRCSSKRGCHSFSSPIVPPPAAISGV